MAMASPAPPPPRAPRASASTSAPARPMAWPSQPVCPTRRPSARNEKSATHTGDSPPTSNVALAAVVSCIATCQSARSRKKATPAASAQVTRSPREQPRPGEGEEHPIEPDGEGGGAALHGPLHEDRREPEQRRPDEDGGRPAALRRRLLSAVSVHLSRRAAW